MLDLDSAGLDYDPDTDTFSHNIGESQASFGSQVGFEDHDDDDEDEDTTGLAGEDEDGDDIDVSTYKKT
jgi:hypothetical protein